MKKFFAWLVDHVELRDILTPLSIRNFKRFTDAGRSYFVGVTEVYLFGFRVARIQLTRPWE
jgi:hypothetical protein